MNEFLLRWAASVLLAAGLGGLGYYAGDHNRNNAWLAKQATQERDHREAVQAEVRRSQAAAAKSISEQQALQTSYATLESKFNALVLRGPIVVFRAVSGSSGTCGERVDAAVGGKPDQAANVPDSGSAGGSFGLDLSLGAVWVWNSALAGTDTPAGACGAADTSPEACAAGSGISLEAAWANHVTNAKTCASDRLRHQRLIDYITAAQGTAP